jgi:hypothetical protein
VATSAVVQNQKRALAQLTQPLELWRDSTHEALITLGKEGDEEEGEEGNEDEEKGEERGEHKAKKKEAETEEDKARAQEDVLEDPEPLLFFEAKVLERAVEMAREAMVQELALLPEGQTVSATVAIQEGVLVATAAGRALLASQRGSNDSSMPTATLGTAVTVHWVATPMDVAGAIKLLKGLRPLEIRPEVDQTQAQLVVGADSEWGAESEVCLIQLAVEGQVWLVDTVSPSEDMQKEVAELMTFLLHDPRVLVVGFAFARDLDKFCEAGFIPSAQPRHLDLQEVAVRIMQQELGSNTVKAWTPGLSVVCQAWLQLNVDKTEQCSEWEQRPLGETQLEYAALDAHVLLALRSVMVQDTKH